MNLKGSTYHENGLPGRGLFLAETCADAVAHLQDEDKGPMVETEVGVGAAPRDLHGTGFLLHRLESQSRRQWRHSL